MEACISSSCAVRTRLHSDELAIHYKPEPSPDDHRRTHDILLDIIQAADRKALAAFVLRFAFTGQVNLPVPDETDYLKEAAVAFLPVKTSKTKRPKALTKTKNGPKQLAKRASK